MKRALPAGLLVLFLFSLAQAQFTADRMFGYMDRNRDGVIDRSESERMPGPFRDALRAMRIDTSRGIDKATLERAWPRMQEEMRAARDREASGGGRSSYSRDGRSSYSRDGRSSYSSRGSSDSRSSYYSRSGSSYGRDDGRSSSSRPDPRQQEKSKPKTKRPPKRKPQPRITVDLPTKFSEVDANRDGQIGLYEWDRAKYKEFFAMDKNHDGFLTPRELTTTTVAAAPSPRTRSTSRDSSTPSRSPAPSSGSQPASGSLTQEKFDPESSDGRRASYVFRSLDRNKDGSLTAEEWQRSQSTRRDFERANVKPPLPANLEQFAGIYLAVRKAGGGGRRR